MQGRRRAVPALSAGRAARVRVAVRARRTAPRVLVVRLAYVAGGQRVVERVPDQGRSPVTSGRTR